MTIFNPVWRVTIEGTIYTNYTLANLTITSGRSNIYEQAQAGYVNLSLINLEQTTVSIEINDAVTIELKDTNGDYVFLFGGNVVDFDISISAAGNIGINQTINIIAVAALARLTKVLTTGTLTADQDGDQIFHILSGILPEYWSQVAPAITWATYSPPGTTWAQALNGDLGEIDRPGSYDLAARTANRIDAYSLVAALATSGLGYLYEDSQGRVCYASSAHRTSYLSANGYTDVSAAQALWSGIRLATRAGDVRNSISLTYGANSANSITPVNDTDSIALYGNLAQLITTTLQNSVDADDQAAFYLTLRSYPLAMMNQITFELTNSEIDNVDRDALINIFMGLPLRIADLPLNMNSGTYEGFVEGFTWKASYNSVSVTALLSPIAFSLQAMKWQDVSALEQWSTISGILEWQDATIVA